VHLTKHHGLGNDFLIAIDQVGLGDPARRARQWCHRTRGVGADGLILAQTSPDGPAVMTLYNADGSRAEISGNGLRCLVQALARRAGTPRWEGAVQTDAGLRRAWLEPTDSGDRALVRVEMGEVVTGPHVAPTEVPVALVADHAVTVDVGNPHLVLHVADPEAVALDQVGPAVEQLVPGGINVHFVMPTSDGDLKATHWERGAGITQACGSGAVASAHAAHHWGAVGRDVTVHMPGGRARVILGSPALLEGDATFVATIEVDGDS
jgi:diaminopimelate epimerase